MQWHGTICILNVSLLSEREISPNYAGIFLDFVYGFGSYVKGLPKTKHAIRLALRFRFGFGSVSVRIRCICETALKVNFYIFTPKRRFEISLRHMRNRILHLCACVIECILLIAKK